MHEKGRKGSLERYLRNPADERKKHKLNPLPTFMKFLE